MLKPITIGKKKFESNLIQAPLAGVSCAPFRELVWQFGGVAYCCTEMLSAHQITHGLDRSPRYQYRAPSEKFLCWQLSGNNPDVLARASAHAIANHADIIDLNCGCPQPKIRQKNCGSRLLNDEKKLSQLISAMKQDPTVPVTIKIRIDAGQGEFDDVAIAQMAEAAGADAVIVHGRHWTHDYDIPAQTEAIAQIVESVSIPVIANGDIADHYSLENIFEKTKCAGFMIGRAGVGQPWLFRLLSDPDFKAPTLHQIGSLFLQHVEGLIALEGEKQAILQSRRLAKYYARALENKASFLEVIYADTEFSVFSKTIKTYFG